MPKSLDTARRIVWIPAQASPPATPGRPFAGMTAAAESASAGRQDLAISNQDLAISNQQSAISDMFTGIVEEIATVTDVTPGPKGHEITIRAKIALKGTILGDSIAVNGTCLTVTDLTDSAFKIGCAPETLSRTNLGSLVAGDRVNLERSLTPSSRMGGHFVQGHIDGTGRILETRPDQESLWLTIGFDPAQMKYVVPKGFIAVDGISLTVVDALDDRFTIMLVAYTQEHVTLASKGVGDLVNIEVDILGKYIERILQARTA